MRKVIVGLLVALAVAVVGIGGYFGVVYWVEQAAAREVDAMLDRWRAGVGSATRGPVEFDLWTRTLKVTDVVVQSPAAPHPRIALAQLVATGVEAPGRADRVEIHGLEVSDAWLGLPGVRVLQKAPRVTLTGFSARPTAPRKADSVPDMLRFRLEQLSAIAAETVEIPSLTVTVGPTAADSARDSRRGFAEYVYSDVTLRDVRYGRVAEASADRLVLRASVGHGAGHGVGDPSGEVSGEIARISIAGVDLRPLLAVLDPARPRSQPGSRPEDGGYQRVYRRIAMGPYTVDLGRGSRMVIDRIVAEDIGLDPARIALGDILFLAEVAGPAGEAPPRSLNRMSMLMDKVAGLYEGIRLGRLEMQDLSVTGGRDTFRTASLRLEGLEDGRLALFSMEGVDNRPAVGDPVRFGRVVLKGLDISSLLRAVPGLALRGPPRPERLVGMLSLLRGGAVEDVVVPDRTTGRPVRLETLDVSWGGFVGGVPTRARLKLRVTGPIGAMDKGPLGMLARQGVADLTVRLDVGASWAEKERTLSLAPATLEMGRLLSLSLKASAGNVERKVFSADPAAMLDSAALVEVGPIEVSVRDLGVVELAAGEAGRAKGLTAAEGRALLMETLAKNAEPLAQRGLDAQPLLQALGELVQGRADTLTVSLTPRRPVRLLELAAAMETDPAGVLADFKLEATAGR